MEIRISLLLCCLLVGSASAAKPNGRPPQAPPVRDFSDCQCGVPDCPCGCATTGNCTCGKPDKDGWVYDHKKGVRWRWVEIPSEVVVPQTYYQSAPSYQLQTFQPAPAMFNGGGFRGGRASGC